MYLQALITWWSGITSTVFQLYGDAPASVLTDIEASANFACTPFLPNVFIETPPGPGDPLMQEAARRVQHYLSDRFHAGGIDALSVAVVTSNGPIYEQHFGSLRANESESSEVPHSHSMYRIASVSKVFAALEGFVLSQKGIMSWDESVHTYLPDFSYRLDGFRPNAGSGPIDEAPITLFQIASHISGIGRDLPAGPASEFPWAITGSGPPPTNGLPFPNHSSLFQAIATSHLVSPPAAYPSYSNTAVGVLGLALAAANRAASLNPSQEPQTYTELIARDVFDPMGLNGSHFLATPENRHMIVVSSVEPEVADLDFLDTMNAAGGQFMSLSDAVTFVQTLLNPTHPKSVLTRYSMNRWTQPVYDFDEDNWTQLGHTWEIIKARDSNSRLRKLYWKLGSVGGYNAAIAFHPGTSYGVALLMTGEYADSAKLTYDIFGLFQPAIDKALADLCSQLYSGQWSSQDGTSMAEITVHRGTMYIDHLVLNGSSVLPLFGASDKVALRPTERRDELRLDIGIPGLNGQKHMGCMPFWNVQDDWGIRNGDPINLLYFTGDDDNRVLHYPSVDVLMMRL